MKFILCVLLVASAFASSNDALADLEAKIFDGSTVTLNQNTLSDDTWSFFENVAHAPWINITSASCDLETSSRYLKCWGDATLFGADGAVNVYFSVPSSDGLSWGVSIDAALTLSLGDAWDMSANVPGLPSDTWLNSLSYAEVDGNLTMASSTFSAADMSFTKGLRIELHNVEASSGLFGLEDISPDLTSAEFDVVATLEFDDKWKLDTADSSVTLDIDTSVPVGTDCATVDKLTAVLTGLDDIPDISVDVSVSLKFSGMDNPLVFTMHGNWDTQTKDLKLSGTFTGPWDHPFGQQWLSIASGTWNMDISAGALSSLTADLQGTWTFGSYSGSADITGTGLDNFKDFSLEFSVDASKLSLSAVSSAVTGDSGSTCLDDVTLDSGSVDIAYTTYATTGKHSYIPGFNLYTTVHLSSGSDIAKLLSVMVSGDLELDLQLQIGIGSSKLEEVKVILSSPKITVNDMVEFDNAQISFDARPATDVTVAISTDIKVVLPNNPDGVVFSASASYDSSSESVAIKGSVTSTWTHPFNLDWLTLTGASVEVDFTAGSSATLSHLEITGDATCSWAKDPSTTISADFVANDDFSGITLTLDVDVEEGSSAGSMVQSLTSSSSSTSAADLAFKGGKVSIVLSTVEAGSAHRGLAINTDVEVTGTGLANTLACLLAGGTGDFELDVFVPIFDSDPLSGTTVYLQAPSIPINDNMKFTGLKLTLSLGVPTTVGLSAGLSVLFEGNPNWLTFNIGGTFSTDGEISIEGGMQGMWDNVFGVTGLDLGNLWLQVSFTATPPYLTGLGLGGEMQFGETALKLNGHVDIEQPATIFFQAEVDNLDFKDIATAYNAWQTDPSKQIDMSDVPDSFDLKTVAFSFAPKDGDVVIGTQTIHFTKGIAISCDVTFLGVDEIKFDLTTPYHGSTPDVVISLDLTFGGDKKSTFEHLMGAYFRGSEFLALDVMDGSDSLDSYLTNISHILPTIKEIDIEDLDFEKIAQKQWPTVTIVLEYFGKDYTYSSTMSISQLLKKLIDMLESGDVDFKSLLGPDCVVDGDCGSGQICRHKLGQAWQCVDACESGDGKLTTFGCVSCKTDAECNQDSGSNSMSSCCRNDVCQPSTLGEFCGVCYLGEKCDSPSSGCSSWLGLCKTCTSDDDCTWSGAAGPSCNNGKCQ